MKERKIDSNDLLLTLGCFDRSNWSYLDCGAVWRQHRRKRLLMMMLVAMVVVMVMTTMMMMPHLPPSISFACILFEHYSCYWCADFVVAAAVGHHWCSLCSNQAATLRHHLLQLLML